MTFLKNNRFSMILLGSMIIGMVIGLIFGTKTSVLSPISDTFLNLLYCIVVPMIFVSLVASISSMKDMRKLGKLLGTMMLVFLASEFVAAIYTTIVCVLFDPGKGSTANLTQKVSDLTANNNSNILSMFTVNDFSLLWSRKSMMALIVFAALFGVALVSIGEKGRKIAEAFDSLQAVIMKMISYIMYIAPIGLGAFFAVLVGQYGSSTIQPILRAIIIFMIANTIYFVGGNSLMAYIGAGIDGVKIYWKNVLASALTALGTSSSAATIPVNLVAAKNMKISNEVADITIPMGANLHKDSGVIITVIKIAFVCSVFHINFFNPKMIITTIFVSIIASTVMGAIPAAGYVGEIFIISAFGFPPESVPLMIALGTITDAPSTVVNVTVDTSASMIIERMLNGKNWLKNKLA